MATSERDPNDATQAFIDALGSLTIADVPTLEYLFIGQLVPALGEIRHSGGATEADAAKIVSVFQTSLMVCRNPALKPPKVPKRSKDIAKYRKALVEGAHSFAAQGPDGITALVAMLFPAVRGQLDDGGDDLDARLRGVYQWVLLALLSGFGSKHPDLWATEGIIEALAAWSEIMVPKG